MHACTSKPTSCIHEKHTCTTQGKGVHVGRFPHEPDVPWVCFKAALITSAGLWVATWFHCISSCFRFSHFCERGECNFSMLMVDHPLSLDTGFTTQHRGETNVEPLEGESHAAMGSVACCQERGTLQQCTHSDDRHSHEMFFWAIVIASCHVCAQASWNFKVKN